MANARRVVVIGGGIVGAGTAWHLARGGAEVVLVDDARPGRATHAGAGIVSWPWRDPDRPIFELRRRAVAAYPQLADEIGARFERVGELHVAPEGELLDDAEQALAAGTGGPVRRLTPAQARDRFPYLARPLAALEVATTARVQGDDIRDRLREAAIATGTELVTGAARLVRGARGIEAVTVDGRRIETTDAVVAAGTWSGALAQDIGVALAVAPQRGQILHLGVDEETSAMPVVHPLGADHYLLAFADRRVVVGATRETGSGYGTSLTAGGIAQVLDRALAVAPGLAGATLREARVGLRPATPDGEPILGAIPDCPGLWAVTGHGPQGLTIGPYCARLVADEILGRPAPLDLAPWASARFT